MRKRTGELVACCALAGVLAVLLIALRAIQPRFSGLRADQVVLSINGDSIRINGRIVAFPMTPETCVVLLGQPNRVASLGEGPRNVYIWDQLGILGFDRPRQKDFRALSFGIADNPEWYRPIPQQWFTGRILVGSTTIDGSSTIGDVKQAMDETVFEKHPITGDWEAVLGKVALKIAVSASGKVTSVDLFLVESP